MIIRANRKTLLLYITLFSAVFNDVLRINGTDISFYRIIMVFSWIHCILKHSGNLKKWWIAFLALSIINGFQSLYFLSLEINNGALTFSRYFSYLYFSFCIFSVMFFVCEINRYEGVRFHVNFYRFIVYCSYIILAIFCYIAISKRLNWSIGLFVSNVNNYGMYLNMVIPIFFEKIIKKRSLTAMLFVMVSIIAMFINDCKINIIAAFVEFLIFIILKRKDRSQSISVRILLVTVFTSVIIIIYLFQQGVILLNGHGFAELISDPIHRLIYGTMYSKSISSIQYRVNISIVSIQWLFRTGFIGIGFGNSNILMRYVLGNYTMKEKLYGYQSISLHNALLELLLDYGFIAIVFFVRGAIRSIRIARKKSLNIYQILYCSIVFSLPIWILSPAGITTTYFLYIILVYFIIVSDEEEDNAVEVEKKKTQGVREI